MCPKCKKELEPCDHHMMGIDKKCFDCQINWTERHGFKEYPEIRVNHSGRKYYAYALF